jgi:hypothetical protein
MNTKIYHKRTTVLFGLVCSLARISAVCRLVSCLLEPLLQRLFIYMVLRVSKHHGQPSHQAQAHPRSIHIFSGKDNGDRFPQVAAWPSL